MRRKMPLVWAILSVLVAAGITFGVAAAFGWVVVPQTPAPWIEQPLGLSLRVASKHRPHHAPTPKQAAQLNSLGLKARTDLLTCIRGVPNPPQKLELVFDGGVVTLASGPVSMETDHGRCVNQVLEGMWGEMSGAHRLVIALSLR